MCQQYNIEFTGNFVFKINKKERHLQRAMDSGRAVSLFPDRLRIFRLTSNPMVSGRDSKRLDETSSSASFCSPAIESGIACFENMKFLKILSSIIKL